MAPPGGARAATEALPTQRIPLSCAAGASDIAWASFVRCSLLFVWRPYSPQRFQAQRLDCPAAARWSEFGYLHVWAHHNAIIAARSLHEHHVGIFSIDFFLGRLVPCGWLVTVFHPRVLLV